MRERYGSVHSQGIVLLVGLMLVILSGICGATGIAEHPSIAVMPFVNKAPVDWQDFGDYAGITAENVQGEMVNSNRFDVVERDQLQMLIDENSLNMTGLTQVAKERKAAKLMGVDYLVMGSVLELSSKVSREMIMQSKDDQLVTKADATNRKVYAKVAIRVVDARTGRIVLYGMGKGASSNRSFSANIKEIAIDVGGVNFSSHQCANAINDASHNALYGAKGIFSILDGKAK